MKIDFKLLPFPHIFIDEFFDENQLIPIWREVIHLHTKMSPPQVTGSAADYRGVPYKKGVGVFIDEVYGDHSLLYSDISILTKRVLSNDFKQNVNEHTSHPDALYFKLYKDINPVKTVTTLLQLYMNGDYYRPHDDDSTFSGVVVLHSNEKKYTGGEFFFPEYDHTINIENNQMIIFPSVILHEVKEVKMNSNNPEDGRFSISLFMKVDHNK
jgi:hypothetical protein